MKCLIFICSLTVPLQVFVIGHVKFDSLDLKQPIKPQIRAVNNLSNSSIIKDLTILVEKISKCTKPFSY